MSNIHSLDMASRRDDELLCKLIDGECSPEERLEIEERLANEVALRARLESFKANDGALRKTFHRDIDAVPSQTIDTLAGHRPLRREPGNWRLPTAIAASTLLAATALLVSAPWNGSEPGTPQMDAAIANTLEIAPSQSEGWSALDEDRRMRVVLTFPAADGQWCREFMLASKEHHWRGVACRDEQSWVTQVIGRDTFLAREGGYRTASAASSEPVEAFIDQAATDVALSGKEEARLIASGWVIASD